MGGPDLRITENRLANGVWRCLLDGGDPDLGPPAVMVRMMGRVVEDISMVRQGAGWRMEVKVPEEAIADGTHTLVATDSASGTRLAHLTLMAGEPVADDLRAEVALLRAELDLLKRAFRRHCDET